MLLLVRWVGCGLSWRFQTVCGLLEDGVCVWSFFGFCSRGRRDGGELPSRARFEYWGHFNVSSNVPSYDSFYMDTRIIWFGSSNIRERRWRHLHSGHVNVSGWKGIIGVIDVDEIRHSIREVCGRSSSSWPREAIPFSKRCGNGGATKSPCPKNLVDGVIAHCSSWFLFLSDLISAWRYFFLFCVFPYRRKRFSSCTGMSGVMIPEYVRKKFTSCGYSSDIGGIRWNSTTRCTWKGRFASE